MRVCVFRHGGIVPPLYGALIRSYEFLVNLIRRGHEVDLHFYGEDNRRFKYQNITFNEVRRPLSFSNIIGKLLYGVEGEWGFRLFFSGMPTLAASARKEISKCDIIYVEHIWSSLFPLIYARIHGKKSVLDNHNVETILANRARKEAKGFLQSFIAFIWLCYVYLLEKISCRLADLVIVTSDFDRDLLHKTVGASKKKIEVVMNGIDLETFNPSFEEGIRARTWLGIDRDIPLVTFVGMLDYPPNLHAIYWIVDELAPKIHRLKPNVHFLMVGRNPPMELIGKDKRIIFTGEVQSVVPHINASDVCIAPMTVGSGTRMKILCYLACEKPVVSTRLGVEGLDSSIIANVSVGDLNEMFELILKILIKPTWRPEANLREIISKYDWKKLSLTLESLLIRLME